jgi:hypothetical protein
VPEPATGTGAAPAESPAPAAAPEAPSLLQRLRSWVAPADPPAEQKPAAPAPVPDGHQAHQAHAAPGSGSSPMSSDMAHEMGHGSNRDLPAMVRDMRNRFWPLPVDSHEAWTSTFEWKQIYGYEFVYGGPRFIHQYSHIRVDSCGIQGCVCAWSDRCRSAPRSCCRQCATFSTRIRRRLANTASGAADIIAIATGVASAVRPPAAG